MQQDGISACIVPFIHFGGYACLYTLPYCIYASSFLHFWHPYILKLVNYDNITAISLPQVGARSLDAGIHGAYYNVLTNLPNVSDSTYAASVKDEADRIAEEATTKCRSVLDAIQQRLAQS